MVRRKVKRVGVGKNCGVSGSTDGGGCDTEKVAPPDERQAPTIAELWFTDGPDVACCADLDFEGCLAGSMRAFVEEGIDRVVPFEALELDFQAQVVGAVRIDERLLQRNFVFLVELQED